MAYKPTFGNSYDNYLPSNNLGYSNVSRGYNKMSARNLNDEHGGLSQLQFMLQNERKKFREAKDRFEMDLDNERKKRIQFQNRLIKLKDEFSRKQVILSQSEFKINNILHLNQDLAVQNDKLKHEIARLEQLYGGKINQLETQLNMETKNFQDTTLQYNEEFDKFKKQGQEYVQHLTFQMQRKIKGLQQKLKASQQNRRDLSVQNKKLNDLLISNRLQFQEQIRDMRNKARDQQVKKAQYLTKTYQQKLKMIEDGKEGLNRKIQELLRALQDKEARLMQLQSQNEDQSNKLRQDNASMQEQINQLNYIVNKLKAELGQKQNLIGRSLNDNDGQIRMLKQQLQAKKSEISQLQGALRDLRMNIKQIESESERKKRQLAQRCYSLQTQARRYKQQYTRLAQILKTKINSTIDNVSYKK